MNARTRIVNALNHTESDRIPICETSYWPETIARWENEGLPKGANPVDYFGLDNIAISHPFDCGFFEYKMYEETDEYVVDLNPYGTTVKYAKGNAKGHQELDHSVKTIEDWRRVRERLIPSEDRLLPVSVRRYEDFTVFNAIDHYWMSFSMCGVENLCCWLVEAPEEMLEIYNGYLDFLIGMLDIVSAKSIEFDGLWFFSDMAFRSGPLFSPKVFREVIAPGYRRLREWCSEHDKRMLLHTDGNVEALLSEYIDIGFDWVQPLEARAGNDVRELKARFGDKITLMGNINADILARGDKTEIEDEIAPKVTAAKSNGGYIYHIDHSVPPTISFETYSYAIELVKKYGIY